MAIVVESLGDEKPNGGIVVESIPGQEPPRTTGESLGRGVGLGARATIKGVLGLPMFALDSGVALGNLINRGTNAVGLTNAGQMPSASELNDRLLTKIGFPEPESAGERIASDVQAAATGGGTLAKVADKLKGFGPEIQRRVLEILAKEPAMQVAAGATAGGAAGATRELGGGPIAQTAAGFAGGLAAPGAAAVAGQVARSGAGAVTQLHKPFTQAGREAVVGATLRRLANDPDAAAAAMVGGADELVPGSAPTTAQSSRDLGLLQAERALASVDPKFAARRSSNNAARNRALDDVAGSEADLTKARGDRETQGKQLYNEAFGQPLRPDAPLDPLLSLTKRPAFQDAIKRAQRLAQEAGEDKLDIMLDPKGLHYIKMALDDKIGTAAQQGIGAAERRAIVQTREDFLGWLEDASPAYAKAKSAYAEASKPVNQMEAGQEIQKATRVAGPDAVTGDPIISQAKWQNVVTSKIDELGKTLSPEHIKTLRAIGNDLDRAVASDSAGKAAGSNTFQNLSTANVIGAALGDRAASSPVAQTLTRPLQWLYKIPEQDVKDLLVQAMLDPKIARALMSKGTEANVHFVAAALRDKARAIGIGAAGGTNPSERER
jgi:hypothetical protein